MGKYDAARLPIQRHGRFCGGLGGGRGPQLGTWATRVAKRTPLDHPRSCWVDAMGVEGVAATLSDIRGPRGGGARGGT